MLLSIVIVNYRVPLLLEQCLHSVFRSIKHVPGDVDVWVVDNASGDDSLALSKSRYPEVHYIENRENVGFARANNQAIKESTGKYVLLLNPDTVIGESTLKDCLLLMEQHTKVGGLGVRMMDAHGDFLPESKRGFPSPSASFFKLSYLYRLFPKNRTMGRYYMGWLPMDEANEVEVLAGAFMMMRRSVLDKVGLLDERFFMYGEDIDLSHRIVLGGAACYYLPVPILHYKGESSSATDLKYLKSFNGAMQLFFDKYYQSKMGFLGRCTISFAISMRTLLAKALRRIRLMRNTSVTEDRSNQIVHYINFDNKDLDKYKVAGNLDLLIDTTTLSYDDILSYMQLLSGRGHTFHFQRGREEPIISPSKK